MKFNFKFVVIELLVFSIYIELSLSKNICPKICYCDVFNELNRATCTDHKIISVDVGVPRSVQIYDLSENLITQIDDDTFRKLNYESLIELDLSHNTISWIGLHAFAGLSKLRTLNLANNRLEGFAHDVFFYNELLTSLDISGNKFINFKQAPFLSHKNLQILNMSSSQISYLPNSALNELPKLRELDLRENYLTQMSFDVLQPLNDLKIISLRGNSWQCNNVLQGLIRWLESHKVTNDLHCEVKPHIQKFEKIQNMAPEPENEEDLDELWMIEDENTEINDNKEKTIELDEESTFLMLYNERVPSLISLGIGFQLGLVIGILGAYCWIRQLYSCGRMRLPSSRRRRIRVRRNEMAENGCLLNSAFPESYATPPIVRRQFSNTVNSAPVSNTVNLNHSLTLNTFRSMSLNETTMRESQIESTLSSQRLRRSFLTIPSVEDRSSIVIISRQNSELRNVSATPNASSTNRSETPPPTYRESWNDTVIIGNNQSN